MKRNEKSDKLEKKKVKKSHKKWQSIKKKVAN